MRVINLARVPWLRYIDVARMSLVFECCPVDDDASIVVSLLNIASHDIADNKATTRVVLFVHRHRVISKQTRLG